MPKITSINRNALRVISETFLKELNDIADDLGIEIKRGRGTYGGGTGSIKIEISVKDNGTGKTGAQAEFEIHARMHGIDPKAFGKSFVFDQRKPWITYKVCGVNPGSPKYRFSAKRNDGRAFKFTAETLRKHFPGSVNPVAIGA